MTLQPHPQRRARPGGAALLAATLATLGTTAPLRAESPAVSTIRIEGGARFFDAECRRCHAVDSKYKSYGPPLEGVIGRPAGSVEGYPYSPALKAAGFTWTEGALRAWMEDNQGLIPGTKMRHVGITDPVEQAFILAWLGSVSAPK